MSLFYSFFPGRRCNTLLVAATLTAGVLCCRVQAAGTADIAATTAQTAAAQLAQDYIQATAGFDQTLLQQILAPDYQEISPVGEVDSREKVISFYPAAAKAKTPAVTPALSELSSRVYGEQLVISTAKLTYSFAGTPHTRSMRVQFVSALQQDRWQLVSTQLTGIAAPKNND